MKSKQEINKQYYQKRKDSIKAQRKASHKATYSPAERKLKYSPAQRKLRHDATYSPAERKLRYSPAERKLRHDATYSPARRKLEYIRQQSAKAQKVSNEQFCNRSTTRSTESTRKKIDFNFNLPIETKESLKQAIKCDQKSMLVEGEVDVYCLPVCLICAIESLLVVK